MLADIVQRYWVPDWSLSTPQTQSTLQHPACLIVISNTYARMYGTVRGLSTVQFDGDGWAVGTMLTPAAGRLIWGAPVGELTDRYVDLGDVPSLDATALVTEVRTAMADEPESPAAHGIAIAAVERRLTAYLPIDDAGQTINRLIAWSIEHPEVTRVDELCAFSGLSERGLQRLVVDRLGLSPKWLLQRRRLHDAVERLKQGECTLAGLSAELGYVDQAHFTRDFRTVTGMTPGAFLADQA